MKLSTVSSLFVTSTKPTVTSRKLLSRTSVPRLTRAMAEFPEPDAMEIAKTVAVARLLLGPDMNLQVPPNLNPDDHRLLLRAGINDWGGISPVTEDYVNPEAAWPHIQSLADTCREEGFELCERLAIYDEYIERQGFLPDRLEAIVLDLQAAIA